MRLFRNFSMDNVDPVNMLQTYGKICQPKDAILQFGKERLAASVQSV